jgi:hypothetical protein
LSLLFLFLPFLALFLFKKKSNNPDCTLASFSKPSIHSLPPVKIALDSNDNLQGAVEEMLKLVHPVNSIEGGASLPLMQSFIMRYGV